eukprot:TRINITY_DN36245_c0_g1_i1.p1 TRINITY_DN36245_c0_g1~~TRINITY_DN36245_c0_g1_i1.p1  ORF type:complete len:82 (-),score=21.41 TRINITY_DN36245_c0_g1_i1:13-258(-)
MSKKDLIFWVKPEETIAPIEIDWNCPCIPAAFKSGPCRDAFAESYTCFIRSKAPEKGSDCIAAFERMSACLNAHPELKDLQ